MTAIVSLRNVVKSYTRGKQRVEVLHALNLDIQSGEFVALMGPSGSGKTTLLNLIGGLDTTTSGEVTVAGVRIDSLSGGALAKWRARHVGFVFQFYNLLPQLSAERNVELPLLLTSLSSAQRKKNVQTALAIVGLADRAKHKPAELSGGQAQRVAIARALVSDPTLLVCDEPTGDLDRATADEILGLLQSLNREQGKTIVMVTHDPKAAEYASHQLYLDKGALVDRSEKGRRLKFLPLIWGALWRKKTRTVFTLLSIIVAFLLFGILQGVNAAFNATVDRANVNRLIVASATSFTESLPYAFMAQIESVPGVEHVSNQSWFGTYYQDPKNLVFSFPTEPARWKAVGTEYTLPQDQFDNWVRTRTGAVIGVDLARQFGWKIGDRVPLHSVIWTRSGGSSDWEFDIVGIYSSPDSPERGNQFFFNYSYFDEARNFSKGRVGWYVVQVKDPHQSAQIASTIDKLFANSTDETETKTEKEFQQSFLKQIGDINFIVTRILFAVFFALLFATGSSLMQSVRERIPELAVLKTLGFSDGAVLGLVLAESLLLCVLAALAGLGFAMLLFPALRGAIGVVTLPRVVLVEGVIMAVLLALATGLLPAWRARQLNIVDALAGR